MTVRNIKKNLAGAEDLLHGIGVETQSRGGSLYEMHKLDTYVPTYDMEEMKRSSLTFMRLYTSDIEYTDYRRNPTGTVGIPSDLGGVWEVVKVSSKVKVFTCVAAMVADTSLVVGQIVETISYYKGWAAAVELPKGGNTYEIVPAGTGVSDGGMYIDLSGNGLQAKALFKSKIVDVAQYGAHCDGVTEDTQYIQNALNSGFRYITTKYNHKTNTLVIPSYTVFDLTIGSLTLVDNATSHNPVIQFGTSSTKSVKAKVKNGVIKGNSAGQTYLSEEWSPGVMIWGSDNCKVVGVEITDCAGDGVTIGYDSGRVESSNGNRVENCEIYGNKRQQVAITYGNENKVLFNEISGNIDIEINTGSFEAKNNIIHGNSGRTKTESLTAPRISDLAIAVATVNTDPTKTYGNIISDNSCFNITVQYTKNTKINNNLIVGSNTTQDRLLTLNGNRNATVSNNTLDANTTVATNILNYIVKDFGNSGLLCADNKVIGDSATLAFIGYAAAYGAETASNRTFNNNSTESGYYWYGGASDGVCTERAVFRIDQVNGGNLSMTQIAGVKCYSIIARSGANAVISRPGNNAAGKVNFLSGCNNTTSSTFTKNAIAMPTITESNGTQTVSMFTFTPAAGAVSLIAFSFASTGGTGTFFFEALF